MRPEFFIVNVPGKLCTVAIRRDHEIGATIVRSLVVKRK